MTPVEFRGDLELQKTRVPGLSCGVVCVILRLAVLVEHRLVTDKQTDRQTQGHGMYRGCIASRGKKRSDAPDLCSRLNYFLRGIASRQC